MTTGPASGARAHAFLAAAALFWSANFVLGAAAVETIDPVSLNALRWGLAAPPLLLAAQLIEKPDWRAALRRLPLLTLLSILGFVGFGLLIYSALKFTSPLNGALISGLNPALIVVTAAIVHRTRIHAWTAVGLVIALSGVVLVITEGDVLAIGTTPLNPGDLLMLAAIAAWATYTILWGRLSEVPPITATALQVTISAVIIIPIALATGLTLPGDVPTWFSVAGIVIFPSIGGYLLWNAATKKVSPSTAAIYLNLIAVYTALLGLAFGYGISGVQIIGGVLVIGAVTLIVLTSRARRKPLPDAVELTP